MMRLTDPWSVFVFACAAIALMLGVAAIDAWRSVRYDPCCKTCGRVNCARHPR